ncbi:MAG: tetratricopeptide repeat protein, partial [Gemmatimonadales bacterium]
VAGLLFAVHPVHVEAVANVVGRNEAMAALFTLLAVYGAVVRHSVGWSAAAMAAGILSKENAAVAPGLVGLAWAVGLAPLPSRRKLVAFLTSWGVLAAGYGLLRWSVLHEYGNGPALAPVFLGEGPATIRLTAVAALPDVARLLVFPLDLTADYSPNERTAVTTVLHGRFALGFTCLAVWAALFVVAWRRGRRLEAFGLGWIGIAYLPVANLLFPHAVLVAERLLYLPSAGLALAAGAGLGRLPPRRVALFAALLVLAGGVRSALRVPVWRNNATAALSLVADAPDSYRTWDYAGWELLWRGNSGRALESFRRAGEIYSRDARVWLAAAHMALVLGRPALADSLLDRANAACDRCVRAYRDQAGAARLRGDGAAADTLLARAARLRSP